jgi:hypothetical protein
VARLKDAEDQNLELIAKNKSQSRQISDLNYKLTLQEGQAKAIFEYRSREFAIAKVCDFGFAVCPDFVAQAGRMSIQESINDGMTLVVGYAGLQLWVLLILKIVALCAFVFAIGFVILMIWLRWGQPEAIRIEQAKTFVIEAQARADEITFIAKQRDADSLSQLKVAKERTQALDQANHAAQVSLDATLGQIQVLEDQLIDLEDRLAKRRELMDALSSRFV